MDNEIKEVLGWQLYDILNLLGLQLEEKNTKHEEIIIRAFNSHTKKYNTLTVRLEETK